MAKKVMVDGVAYTPLDVAEQIVRIVDAMKAEGKLSKQLIEAKADAIAEYDKALAVAALIHRTNGMPTTLIPVQAKGDACDFRREMEKGMDFVKAHFKRLEVLEGQKTGWQSVNKHLENV